MDSLEKHTCKLRISFQHLHYSKFGREENDNGYEDYSSKSVRNKTKDNSYGTDLNQERKSPQTNEFSLSNRGTTKDNEENPIPKRQFGGRTKVEDPSRGMNFSGQSIGTQPLKSQPFESQPFNSQPLGGQGFSNQQYGNSAMDMGLSQSTGMKIDGDSRPSGARVKNFRPVSRGSNAG